MSALRDALTEMLYDTAKRKEPIGYVVDDILETLREHRDETLEALGGERVTCHDRDCDLDYFEEPHVLWAFPEAGEQSTKGTT